MKRINKLIVWQSKKIASKINVGYDKVLHFQICFVVAFVLGLMFMPFTFTGFIGAIMLGIGKEYGDYKCPANRWSWYDFLADFLGAIAGYIVTLLFI